jgi:hypothetical protein
MLQLIAISLQCTDHAPKAALYAVDTGAALPHNSSVGRTLLTVVEMSAFSRRAEKLLTREEHDDLLLYLSIYHHAGDEIPGTGGVRKLRYAAQGKGKSGGVRAIYYFYDQQNPLYALLLYGKNEQSDLSPDQKRHVTAIAAAAKAEAKARKVKSETQERE